MTGPSTAAIGLGDLLDRTVFDERTGAVAISHGKSSFPLVGRRRQGL